MENLKNSMEKYGGKIQKKGKYNGKMMWQNSKKGKI